MVFCLFSFLNEHSYAGTSWAKVYVVHMQDILFEASDKLLQSSCRRNRVLKQLHVLVTLFIRTW